MSEKSNFRTKYLCGEVYVEAIVMQGVDGDMELQHVQEVSIQIGMGKEALTIVLPAIVGHMIEEHGHLVVENIKLQEIADDTRS